MIPETLAKLLRLMLVEQRPWGDHFQVKACPAACHHHTCAATLTILSSLPTPLHVALSTGGARLPRTTSLISAEIRFAKSVPELRFPSAIARLLAETAGL